MSKKIDVIHVSISTKEDKGSIEEHKEVDFFKSSAKTNIY